MKSVIYILFVCAFVGSTFAAETTEDFEKMMKDNQEACVKESGVTPESAAKSMKGDFANDKKLNCYLKCMFIKAGYMKADGTVNAEYMKKHPRPDIDASKASAVVDKCKNPSGADACEKARNLANCVNDSLK